MRTIRIWLLLNRLHKAFLKAKEANLDHFENHGHHHTPMVIEQDFIREITKGNKKKRAYYLELLDHADKTLGLIEHEDGTEVCSCCKEEKNVRWIKLSDKGFEFIGFLEFMEFFAQKYPIGWGAILKITTGVIVSLGGSAGLIYLVFKLIQHALA